MTRVSDLRLHAWINGNRSCLVSITLIVKRVLCVRRSHCHHQCALSFGLDFSNAMYMSVKNAYEIQSVLYILSELLHPEHIQYPRFVDLKSDELIDREITIC